MATELFTLNEASTTVSSGGTTAPSAGTTETWTVASSASFPAASSGAATQFHVADPASVITAAEIIAVTNVSGTTWTVTRGAESTTPVAHLTGFTVQQVITAGTLASFQQSPVVTFTFGSSGAAPSSGTYTAGQVATDQNGVIRVCTAGGTPGTWQRAGQKPFEFYVDDYGARGDGKVGTGGTGTSGTTAFSDAGASFTSADAGKVVIINQGAAGSFTNPACTSFSAFVSGTAMTLAASLGATAANAPYIYGTDDAAAISNCVTAAVTWATAHVSKAQVIFSAKFYMLAALTQATSPTQYNCHIPVAVGPQLGTKLSIELVGSGTDSSFPQYWESSFPSLSGTCLVSAVFATAQPNATFGQQSVIGGPTAVTANMGPGNFANTILTLNSLNIVCPWNSQQYGVHGDLLAQMDVYPTGSAQAFAPVNLSGAPSGGVTLANIPNNGISSGFSFPQGGNNANCNMGVVHATGFANGYKFTEHVTGQRLIALYCNNGILVNAPNGHGAAILRYICEASNNGLNTANSVANQTYNIFIGQWESETLNTAHIVDPNSNFTGFVNWSDTSSTRPVVTGGQNLIVVDSKKHFPGPWAGAPAAPATGVTQQNLGYRYAEITLSATTITSVTKGPASTGQTTITGKTQASGGPGVQIRVPPGHYFTVNYTGTLTAIWELD